MAEQIVARPDSLIGPYTIFFGRDPEPFFFVKRDDLLVLNRVFDDYNSAVTAMWHFDAHHVELIRDRHEAECAFVISDIECCACSGDGCAACH